MILRNHDSSFVGTKAFLLCTLALVACGTSALPDERARVFGPTDPELGTLASGLHGKLPDTTTKLYKVTDPLLRTFHLLVSNKRGYRLQCKNSDGTTDDVGVNRLISGAGFNPSNTSSIPKATYDSPELRQDLGISQFDPFPDNSFGALPCNFASADGALLTIDVDNTREFFLDMNEVDASSRKNIIRTVSCGELLSAMGLDLRRALLVDLPVAQLHWTLDDKYNINCARGTPPAQFIPTLALVSGGLDQIVSRGSEIGPLQFRVDHLGANEVVKSLEPLTNECFDEGSLAISSLLVTGRVSGKAPNKTCRTSFVAKVLTGKDSSGNDLFFTTAPLTLTVNLTCEINSLSNCGACGTACVAGANQSAFCAPQAAGAAAFACQKACNNGFGDCDGNAANGCEDPLNSLTNCGQCNNACTAPHSSMKVSCDTRVCTPSCKEAYYMSCDNALANGCEADLLSHDTCGSCSNKCDANAFCAFDHSGPVCKCLTGFVPSADGRSCVDDNECLRDNGGCSENAHCFNTSGGRECSCQNGYHGDGFTCDDDDECTMYPNGACPSDSVCTNIPGYRACNCRPGLTGLPSACQDINECLSNNGGCSPYATCTNTFGSRVCQCQLPYVGNGTTCTNPCQTNNGGCDPNAKCSVSSSGSATCKCNSGYVGNGYSCTEIEPVDPIPCWDSYSRDSSNSFLNATGATFPMKPRCSDL